MPARMIERIVISNFNLKIYIQLDHIIIVLSGEATSANALGAARVNELLFML